MINYDNFNGSNAVRLILKTELDFTQEAPTDIKILYWKPNNTSGEWQGNILTGSETEGKIYYDLTTADSLTQGIWTVRAKLTYGDGRVLYTEKANLNIGE